MKGKIILLLTALVAIGITIALYNLAVDQWTSMIQLSLAVVCICEFAVVCTMGLLPEMNFKNGSTGIMINIYAALMILWSLIGCKYEGNTYPIGLLIISVVMLVIIGVTVMASHESDRLNDEVQQDIDRKQSFTSAENSHAAAASTISAVTAGDSLPAMWLAMQSTIDDYDTKKRVRVLIERIQAMPANRFPDPVIESGVRELTAMSRALSNPDARERILARINTKVTELSNYIKIL